jgi:hypothetical protein
MKRTLGMSPCHQAIMVHQQAGYFLLIRFVFTLSISLRILTQAWSQGRDLTGRSARPNCFLLPSKHNHETELTC